jgi:chromosome segregation ATPase
LIHLYGQHQAEIEHLRLELTRSQKSTADVSERLDKTRKQNEALDVRIQECKKAMLADQAEAKELRAKLRVSEHERMQLSTKQEELVEAKKMLQSLESKRRDELRERDKKILDLEKSVATEKTVRQVAETRLQEIKRKTDEELQESRALSQNLQVQVSDAQHDAQQARSSLSMLENEAALSAEGLVAQLAQYQSLLESVAEEYGRLASVSVPLFVHSRLKSEHATLQLRILRLERKLANSEEQVIELAHLVRQTREENSFLSGRLHDVQDDLVFCSSAFRDVTSTHLRRADESKLQDDLFIIGMDIRDSERQLQHCLVAEQKLVSQFYRIKFDDLLQLYTIVDKALLDEQALVQQHVVDLSTASAAHTSLVSQLDTVQAERDAAQGELRRAITSVKDMRTTRETLEQQLEETKSTMLTQISKSKTALENEREVVHRLTGTVQKSRMAEEGLRAEIEQYVAYRPPFTLPTYRV